MPNRKKVAIIMGSDSDWPVVKSVKRAAQKSKSQNFFWRTSYCV